MEEIIKVINSVGFPIAACCFMSWLYVQMNNTLQGLTIAINTLTTKFDSHVHEIGDDDK